MALQLKPSTFVWLSLVSLFHQQAFAQDALLSSLSLCTELLSTCTLTASSCASSFCNGCTSLGAARIDRCCASANPVPCFAGIGGYNPTATDEDSGPTITPAGNPLRSNDGCSSVSRYLSICESETEGFDDIPVTDQASCLCYNGNRFEPRTWDGFVTDCLSVATGSILATDTDFDSARSLLSTWDGLCQSVGNIASLGRNPTAYGSTAVEGFTSARPGSGRTRTVPQPTLVVTDTESTSTSESTSESASDNGEPGPVQTSPSTSGGGSGGDSANGASTQNQNAPPTTSTAAAPSGGAISMQMDWTDGRGLILWLALFGTGIIGFLL